MSPTTTVWWLLLQIWLHRRFSSLRNGIACASQVQYSSAFRKISSYTLLLSLYTKYHSIRDDDIFFYVHYFIDFVTQTLYTYVYMQVHRISLLQIQPTTIQLSFPPVRLLCSLSLSSYNIPICITRCSVELQRLSFTTLSSFYVEEEEEGRIDQ